MRRGAVALVLPLLALWGCDGATTAPGATATATPNGLEAAAIQAGVIADPASTMLTGLYARDTDRVCIVPAASDYRIGIYIDVGDEQHCSGSGTVSREGETLHIDMGDAKGAGSSCSFDARFEGDRLVLPGRVPEGCQKLCERRASIAALDVARLSDSASEASTLRDAKGRLLCGSGG